MRNKLIKILILLLIAFSFMLGVHGIIQNNSQNTILFEGGAVNTIGALDNTLKIKQDINIRNGEFNNISIFTTIIGNGSDGEWFFKIYKSGNENPIVTKKINMKEIPKNDYLLFDFSSINCKNGEKYYFTIETTSTDENNTSSIWYNPNQKDDFRLFINDKQIEGKLCYTLGYKESYFKLASIIFMILAIVCIIVAYFSDGSVSKKSVILSISFLIFSTIVIYLNISLFYESGYINSNYLIIMLSIIFFISYTIFYDNYLNNKLDVICICFLLLISPLISLFVIELSYNNLIINMNFKILIINYLYVIALYLLTYVVVGKINRTLVISNIICCIIAIMSHYVLLFRGTPILLADFYAMGTAASVVKNYKFEIDLFILILIVAMILNLVICKNIKSDFKRAKIEIYSKFMALSISLFFIVISNNIFIRYGGLIDLWNPQASYQKNGAIVNFLTNARSFQVKNYSIEKVNDIVSSMDYSMKVIDNKNNSNRPNIIAIMNESFADLSVIGDLNTDKDYMPYIHGLKENTIKGELFVSTFGGNTANTEWEFLTGNSMAFIMSGGIPYSQYISNPSNSLATTLKKLDYRTIAMHPFGSTGWNRDKVYPLLGFDEFVTYEDFKNPQMLRNYISDSENYKKIIEKYKQKEKNEKLFIFDVTIQNHGGYLTDNSVFEDNIHLKDYNYDDVNEYLSLIKKSDEAFEELINYFSSQDEPTIILMFGDHLPSLNTEFYEKLYKKPLGSLTLEELQKEYTTPFIIWANYDIKQEHIDKVSANYLSTLLLNLGNQPLTGYNKFLENLNKDIPVINKNGYIDSDGYYYHLSEGDHLDKINDYSILQYNNVFDNKNTINDFYNFKNDY